MKEQFSDSERTSIIQKFRVISRLAEGVISEWRAGSGEIINKVNVNGSADIVTAADIVIERIAGEMLLASFPECLVLGEESFGDRHSMDQNLPYFIVDPIDGTKEFARGSKEWSISLCAVENEVPTVASIYMSDLGQMFTAIKGHGVEVNGEKLTNVAGKRNIAVSPRQIKVEEFLTKVRRTDLNPIEVSALTPKICAVLRGDVCAAIYFPQEGQSAAIWDYAASVLLMSEAGGEMLSLDGTNLPFSGSCLVHTGGWLAASKEEDCRKLIDLLLSDE